MEPKDQKPKDHIPTNNIKMAAALTAVGFELRDPDPVTCEIQEKNGRDHKQYTFWISGDRDKIREYLSAGYAFLNEGEFTLPEEDPFYYALGSCFNRETLLHHMRSATPFRLIREGDRSILLPEDARPDLIAKLQEHL